MAKINIDISKLKNLLKAFGGFRAYSVLIWPAIILLACGAVLTTTILLGRGLKQKVSRESTPIGNNVLIQLKSSPAVKQAEVEKKYQEAYQQDANFIQQLSVQSSERELLSYSIFPQPKDTSTLLFTQFGENYRQGIEAMIKKVNGHDCPSAADITVAMDAGKSSAFSKSGGDSEPAMRIVDEICRSRAKSSSVYASPDIVSGYDFWKTYKYANIDDSIKDCWFWQTGYWIIEDVFTTVEKMNTGSNSVFSSPVKRVERVGFLTPDALWTAGTTGSVGGSKVAQERPRYVTKPEEQLTESFTSRVSNESLDVVHFSLVVVLSTKAIVPFMRELCSAKEHSFRGFTGQDPEKIFKHNQITILESRVKPLSSLSADNQYYRYGSDSVAEVEMVCEYIFNKQGYDAIKPDLIKGTAAAKPGN
jgi:hypothetical protein